MESHALPSGRRGAYASSAGIVLQGSSALLQDVALEGLADTFRDTSRWVLCSCRCRSGARCRRTGGCAQQLWRYYPILINR